LLNELIWVDLKLSAIYKAPLLRHLKFLFTFYSIPLAEMTDGQLTFGFIFFTNHLMRFFVISFQNLIKITCRMHFPQFSERFAKQGSALLSERPF